MRSYIARARFRLRRGCRSPRGEHRRRAGSPAAAAAPPLPVRKVVLYKHGMGYLERRGNVTGDATVSFSFRADQMKDLLTSFYAVDLGGGTITSVRYDTAEPLARRLQEILIKVPESAALSQFLPQLKGARISARVSGEEFVGRVLGLEPFTESSDGKVVRQGHRLVILTDAGAMRSADLAGIAELAILDEGLRADVVRLLDLALEGRRADAKRLAVTASGKGERELRVGYLVEMPVWKCSYRLILDPEDKEKALLQGWAQAENTSGEDWENIAVSFVAGNPLSFSMDMYTPLYVPRPQVPVPGLQNLAVNWGAAPAPETAAEPQAYRQRAERDFEKKASRPMAPAPAMAAGFAAQRMDASMAEAAAEETQLAALLETSGGAAAQGAKVGELFSYEARDPVSIPRGQAALVPIVSKRIAGRRVLVYQASFSPRPVNAWVLANDTDLTFEAGAVTFFEGSTSLGEGILGHTLPPGGQEVVPYAVDASVDVTPKVASRQEPYIRGKVADGVLQLTRVEVLANTWSHRQPRQGEGDALAAPAGEPALQAREAREAAQGGRRELSLRDRAGPGGDEGVRRRGAPRGRRGGVPGERGRDAPALFRGRALPRREDPPLPRRSRRADGAEVGTAAADQRGAGADAPPRRGGGAAAPEHRHA